MDATNLQLLQLLQKNARMTVTELALAVGRSESTVRERIAALESRGCLQGYQARIDWAQVGLPASAVISARCEPNRIQEVARQLAAIPNVTRAMLVTGPRPIMAVLRVRDLQHLHQILRDRLSQGDLTHVEAELVLENLVEHRPPSLAPPPADPVALVERGLAPVPLVRS